MHILRIHFGPIWSPSISDSLMSRFLAPFDPPWELEPRKVMSLGLHHPVYLFTSLFLISLSLPGPTQVLRDEIGTAVTNRVNAQSHHTWPERGGGGAERISKKRGCPGVCDTSGVSQFDSLISPAAIVPHEERVLWATNITLWHPPC